jgi:hypothetical protein
MTINSGDDYPSASHDTVFINNYGDVLPTWLGGRYDLYPSNPKGEGIWFVSLPEHQASGVMAIGNVLRNTGNANFDTGIVMWSVRGARLTWNVIENDAGQPPPGSAIRLDDHYPSPVHDVVVAHNQLQADQQGIWSDVLSASKNVAAFNRLISGDVGLRIDTGGTWDIHDNDFTVATSPVLGAYERTVVESKVPPAPAALHAQPWAPGEVLLRWSYGEPEHDSFYVEMAVADAPFQRLAVRPPNLEKWRFDAPTNADWRRLDTTAYLVQGLQSGSKYRFRIRAHNSDEISPWSPVAIAVAP